MQEQRRLGGSDIGDRSMRVYVGNRGMNESAPGRRLRSWSSTALRAESWIEPMYQRDHIFETRSQKITTGGDRASREVAAAEPARQAARPRSPPRHATQPTTTAGPPEAIRRYRTTRSRCAHRQCGRPPPQRADRRDRGPDTLRRCSGSTPLWPTAEIPAAAQLSYTKWGRPDQALHTPLRSAAPIAGLPRVHRHSVDNFTEQGLGRPQRRRERIETGNRGPQVRAVHQDVVVHLLKRPPFALRWRRQTRCLAKQHGPRSSIPSSEATSAAVSLGILHRPPDIAIQ